jgi:hypothetical protein
MSSAYTIARPIGIAVVADDPPITGVDDVICTRDRNDTDGGSIGFAARGPF